MFGLITLLSSFFPTFRIHWSELSSILPAKERWFKSIKVIIIDALNPGIRAVLGLPRMDVLISVSWDSIVWPSHSLAHFSWRFIWQQCQIFHLGNAMTKWEVLFSILLKSISSWHWWSGGRFKVDFVVLWASYLGGHGGCFVVINVPRWHFLFLRNELISGFPDQGLRNTCFAECLSSSLFHNLRNGQRLWGIRSATLNWIVISRPFWCTHERQWSKVSTTCVDIGGLNSESWICSSI